MPLETTNVSDFLAGSSDNLLEQFQNKTAAPTEQPKPAAAPAQQAAPATQVTPPNNSRQIFQNTSLTTEPGASAEDIIKKFTEDKATNPTESAKPEEVVDQKPEGEEDKPEEGKEPEGKKKGGRPVEKVRIPEKPSELVSLLEERGVLKGFADGKYETVDDLVELLQANEESKISQFQKQAEENLFSRMTPAMQLVAQYAGKIQNPADLQPFITAVDNVAYSAELNVEDPYDQEAIIRNALEIKGIPEDVIESDIKDFKERNILADRAKTFKPVLDRYNQQKVAQMVQEQEMKSREQEAYWQKHQQQVFEKVVKPATVGGIKLKKQHRDVAFAALAAPDPQLGGLGIYAVVDDLLQKGDFESLTEMLLVGLYKKDYHDYISAGIKSEMSENTQRVLRTIENNTAISSENNSSVSNDPNKLTRPSSKSWFSSYNKK